MVTHGERGTRLYRVWAAMKTRTGNPNYRQYIYYGGRGISICDEWQNSFIAFRDWALSHGYRDDLEIDRADNNGNYCPSNCRFVTRSQNCMNRRLLASGKSKYRGVSWYANRKKWRACIKIDGKQKWIGAYRTQLEAAIAYDDAAHEIHGQYASLNFPERKRA